MLDQLYIYELHLEQRHSNSVTSTTIGSIDYTLQLCAYGLVSVKTSDVNGTVSSTVYCFCLLDSTTIPCVEGLNLASVEGKLQLQHSWDFRMEERYSLPIMCN